MVKLPPSNSAGFSAPSCAFLAKARTVSPIWRTVSVCALATMGVIRPSGMATAMLISALSWRVTVVPSKVAFTAGCRRSASAAARTTRSFTVTLTPSKALSSSRRRESGSASMRSVR